MWPLGQRTGWCSISVFLVLVAATAIDECAAGRVNAPAKATATKLHLRVTRQAEATDEGGKPFAKVYLQGGALSQDTLDSMVVAGQVPELMFTDQTQRHLFETFKSRSFPVELHVEKQDASPVCNGLQGGGRTEASGGQTEASTDTYVESYGNVGVHELVS